MALLFIPPTGIFALQPGETSNPEALKWFRKGEALYNGRRWEEFQTAIEHYSKAIRADPAFARAYTQRGRIYTGHVRDQQKARADIEKALELAPDMPEAHYALGNIHLFLTGELKKAIGKYDDTLRLKPGFFFGYYNRATAAFRLKNHDKALLDYGKAIKINPDYFWTYMQRGRIFLIKKKYRAALKNFDEALILSPRHGPTYFLRGSARMHLGQSVDSIKDVATACRYGFKRACDSLDVKITPRK